MMLPGEVPLQPTPAAGHKRIVLTREKVHILIAHHTKNLNCGHHTKKQEGMPSTAGSYAPAIMNAHFMHSWQHRPTALLAVATAAGKSCR